MDLAAEAKRAARIAEHMPADLAQIATSVVYQDIARPLAGEVARAATGRVASRIDVTAEPGVVPALRVGGQHELYSGGATGAQTFYGTEFGGGKKWKLVTGARSPKGHVYAYNRHTTMQFVPPEPFVYPTFRRVAVQVLETWETILDPLIEEWGARHGFA